MEHCRPSFLGLIPARYASTRFPGKPLVDIGGKSMIQRVYEQASRVVRAVVATDDSRIEAEVLRFGGEVVMTSPHHRSGTDRCAEALDIMEVRLGEAFDVVLNIQGDEPFIRPEQLAQLMACFEDEATQIATLVRRMARPEDVFDPNQVKALRDLSGRALYFSRSPVPFVRDASKEEWLSRYPYLKHIGMYAYRGAVLRQLAQLAPSALEVAESLEQNRWIEHGFCIRVAETEDEGVYIDTPEDLERVRQSLSKLQ